MISDERIEKAVGFLVTSASEIAKARADMNRADHMRRVTKALIMKQHVDLPVSAQEREAYAHEDYKRCLNELWEYTQQFERLRAKREAEIQVIDAWRSMSANRRGIDRVG